ncbi:hypothetical protein ZWY2020_005011 [Hordeum vulgare]|nr:hypothetical protein ZWY2020_005011 [Hordeum vulgare]
MHTGRALPHYADRQTPPVPSTSSPAVPRFQFRTRQPPPGGDQFDASITAPRIKSSQPRIRHQKEPSHPSVRAGGRRAGGHGARVVQGRGGAGAERAGVPVEVGGEGGRRGLLLDDALFHVLYAAEAVVLSAALCGFFLCCGCNI